MDNEQRSDTGEAIPGPSAPCTGSPSVAGKKVSGRMIAKEKMTGWNYQTETVALLPYICAKDAIFPEEFLVSIYLRFKGENLLGSLFPGNPLNLVEFVSNFKDRPLVVGMVHDAGIWKVMGIGWLWEVEGPAGARKASCAYAFFREFWGRDEVRKIARMALRYWFEEFGVRVIYGAALKSNVRAQRFDREMGLKKVADLQKFFIRGNQMFDAVLVSITYDEFLASEG